MDKCQHGCILIDGIAAYCESCWSFPNGRWDAAGRFIGVPRPYSAVRITEPTIENITLVEYHHYDAFDELGLMFRWSGDFPMIHEPDFD